MLLPGPKGPGFRAEDRMKIIQFALIFLLILGLAQYASQNYFFNNWEQKQLETKKQIDTLKTKNNANEHYRLNAQELEKQAQEIEIKYKEIEKFLPSDDQVDEIFNNFTSAAQRNRLFVGAFDNKHPAFKSGLNEAPFSITLDGSGSTNHQNFLQWVADYPQLIVVKNAKINLIQPPNRTSMTIKGSLVVDIPQKKKNA